MKDNLYTGKEVREKLYAGIKKVSDAVGSTMGTGGSNAVIEAMESPGHYVTNDGYSIANSIRLADPVENMGKNILLEAINRANKASGDGSSTTCVLTSSIIEQGITLLSKASAMDVKNSLEACIPLIEQSLAAQTREITVEEVGKVATVSAEDAQIGATIQEIYEKIGKEGIIHWDISKTYEDHYDIGSGITINGAGFASPYMSDLDEKTGQFLNVALWNNPKILITKQKITSAADFNDLFQALFNKEIKEVVVFCDEYEAPVVGDLIRTRAVRGFKTLLIKMPVLWKDQWYEDLAHVTGATVIDPNAGISFKTLKFEHLGTVEHIKVTKDDTFLDGIADISRHVAVLEEEATDDSKLRASRLNTKTARYYVGAHSDSALAYRRLKVEDAISSAWQALHGGIVAGGGVALNCVAAQMPDTPGGNILKVALVSPMKTIMANVGIKELDLKEKTWHHGLDTRTGSIVDMFEAGICDPANVVRNACKQAISVAASILTAETMVILPREDKNSQQDTL